MCWRGLGGFGLIVRRVDPLEDLRSCGGCVAQHSGRDCYSIPGSKSVGCDNGNCVGKDAVFSPVYSFADVGQCTRARVTTSCPVTKSRAYCSMRDATVCLPCEVLHFLPGVHIMPLEGRPRSLATCLFARTKSGQELGQFYIPICPIGANNSF